MSAVSTRAASALVERTIDGAALVSAGLAGTAMLGATGLILAEIVARTIFGASFPAVWEYAGYAVAVTIFGGLGWTLRTGGHIRVTLLREVLPGSVAHLVEITAAAVGAALAGFLATALVALATASFVDGTRSYLGTETPLWIPQALVAFGASVFAAQAVMRVVLLLVGRAIERAAPGDAVA